MIRGSLKLLSAIRGAIKWSDVQRGLGSIEKNIYARRKQSDDEKRLHGEAINQHEILTKDNIPINKIISPFSSNDEVLNLSVENEVNCFGGDVANVSMAATNVVLSALPGRDFSAMARNSPELRGIDWAPYISLSVIRVARALDALMRYAPRNGRILDFGSYFGNFSIALARSGYRIDALDDYGGAFGGTLEPFASLISEAGGSVLEISEIGYDLSGLEPRSYDAVLFMGAIEHIPHTPRHTLESITRVLKPGGHLILDTPNLGYVYNRRKFISGETIFPPLEYQFQAEIPFFGHHREYLPSEISWMLERVGHNIIENSTYNFSAFGMSELSGEHLALWRLMDDYPQLRELIFTVSRAT